MEMYDEQELELLKHSKLLRGLSYENLSKLLTISRKLSRTVGETILAEGEKSDKIYIILSGKVTLFKKDIDGISQQFITTLGPGQSLGEMRLIKDQPCTLTVIVSEPVILVSMSITELQMKAHHDVFVALLTSTFTILNDRIIESNTTIAKSHGMSAKWKRLLTVLLGFISIGVVIYYLYTLS
jgi:CRP/FNR family transcriptional regulator, cyclic AMP receptor protein